MHQGLNYSKLKLEPNNHHHEKIIIILLAIGCQLNLQAKVWRVNNNDATANFKDIKAAHDDSQVLAGDTLMVEGSQTYYTSFTCTKKLVIVGPGYFLSDNYQSADVLPAKISHIYLNSGSEGSSVIGLTFDYDNSSSPTVYVNNINIERCFTKGGIHLRNVENVRIINCYTPGVDDYDNSTLFNNIYFNNNIVTDNMAVNSNCHFISCKNNIFLGSSYTFNAFHFRNNIVMSGTATMNINSAYIQNNIATNNIFGAGNLNITDINALFTGGNSPDGKYVLSQGSLAKGAGFGGIDCGIFGGDDPYIISGLPPVPIITELDVDDAVSNKTGLKVKIKARAN